MKCIVVVLLSAAFMVSCDKKPLEAKAVREPEAVKASVDPAAPEKKKLPPVPEGKLQKMDPEKAKFIAVPSTPKDPQPQKVVKPAPEVKKADKPATEIPESKK